MKNSGRGKGVSSARKGFVGSLEGVFLQHNPKKMCRETLNINFFFYKTFVFLSSKIFFALIKTFNKP